MYGHEPDDADEDYGYDDCAEYGAGGTEDGTHVTIRPVYADEAASYLDDLVSGRCPPERMPSPSPQPVSEQPAEPISLRDELKEMGLL